MNQSSSWFAFLYPKEIGFLSFLCCVESRVNQERRTPRGHCLVLASSRHTEEQESNVLPLAMGGTEMESFLVLPTGYVD